MVQVLRTTAVALAFALIAVALIHLRTAQTRAAASLLRMEAQRIALRRELWEIETRNARLRAPAHIHEAADRLPIELDAPGPDEPLRGPSTLLVQRR